MGRPFYCATAGQQRSDPRLFIVFGIQQRQCTVFRGLMVCFRRGRQSYSGVLIVFAPLRRSPKLTAVEGGTLLSLLITSASNEMRDTILATGMTSGMEASYTRLERDVLIV